MRNLVDLYRAKGFGSLEEKEERLSEKPEVQAAKDEAKRELSHVFPGREPFKIARVATLGADPAFFDWEVAKGREVDPLTGSRLENLSREEEAELIRRAIPEGDPWIWEPEDWHRVDWKAVDWDALHVLLRHHMQLFFDVLYQWRRHHDLYGAIRESDDLRQVGIEVLIESFVGFNPEIGVRFNTYAKPRIRRLVTSAIEDLFLDGLWSRELRGYDIAHKKATNSFAARDGREPWYGELVTNLAALAPNEIRAVWLSLWPEDVGNVGQRLEAIAEGDSVQQVVRQLAARAYSGENRPPALVEKVEALNKVTACLSVLRSGVLGAQHPVELDAESEIGGEPENASEPASGHEILNPGGYTLDSVQGAKDQGQREARVRFIASLIDSDPRLTPGQREVLIGTLGLDVKGSRTPTDLAEELGRRPDAVALTLTRAARHIKDRIEAAAGDGERLEANLKGETFDPFAGTPDAFFNPFEDDPYGAEEGGVGIFSDPFQDDASRSKGYRERLPSPEPAIPWGAWDKAVREAIQWARGEGRAFEPDLRGWWDPVAGNLLRSAPSLSRGPSPVVGRAISGSWDDEDQVTVQERTALKSQQEAA